MRKMLALAITLVLGWFSLTANAQVSTDYDRSVDFGQYRTYAFTKPNVRVKNPLYNGPLLMQQIEGDLTREFGRRGLNKRATKPDLLIQVHTYTKDKTRDMYNESAYTPFFPYRFGFMPFWGGVAAGDKLTVRRNTRRERS